MKYNPLDGDRAWTYYCNLPKEQQGRALKWGIIGAYVLRGACLIFAAWLIKILWLKIVVGIYLLYLAYQHFLSPS